MHGLQGPIDDAFMDSFVFVRPSGTPLSAALGEWEQEQADYAVSEWVHFFRGEPRVKRDTEVSAADIAAHNLVLFGDPVEQRRLQAHRRPAADRVDAPTVSSWRADLLDRTTRPSSSSRIR